jgi:hypothetical protein
MGAENLVQEFAPPMPAVNSCWWALLSWLGYGGTSHALDLSFSWYVDYSTLYTT